MGVSEIFLGQLKSLRDSLRLALILLVSLLLDLPIHVLAFALVSYLMVAAVTAVHEGLHARRAAELGYPVSEFEVLGLGNVRYRLEAPPEVRRDVARAPYLRPHQYLVELGFLVTLYVISAGAPVPFRYLLPGVSLLATLHLVSVACVYLTFRLGVCGNLARFASGGDLEEGLSE